MITHATKLNVVIGYPLPRSSSPVLHNALYNKLSIDAVLLRLPGPNVKKLITIIKEFPVGFACVTMPHKQSVMKYLDIIDKQAKAIGAVNTIINKEGKLYGYNTDINGIAFALRQGNFKNKNVLLLGAGGAARAVAYYLCKQGAKIFYLNRTRRKAVRLQKDFGGRVINYPALSKLEIGAIINATSVGMHPNVSQTPLPEKYFKRGQIVFDVIGNSTQSRFLREAKSVGCVTASGLDMFIGQALRQIEIYTGKKIINKKNIKFAFKQMLQ